MIEVVCVKARDEFPDQTEVGKTYYMDETTKWRGVDGEEYARIYKDINKVEEIGNLLVSRFKEVKDKNFMVGQDVYVVEPDWESYWKHEKIQYPYMQVYTYMGESMGYVICYIEMVGDNTTGEQFKRMYADSVDERCTDIYIFPKEHCFTNKKDAEKWYEELKRAVEE